MLANSTWFSPAGGALYHARALWGSRRAWRPFRAALAEWLVTWQTPSSSLLLVGPSAGYCLTDALFTRFRDIAVLEPDPAARFLLRRRLRRLGVAETSFSSEDLLLGGTGDPSGLARALEREPERAVLFCNVLGQVRFLLPEAAFESWVERFRERVVPVLATRAFASFHDRLSGSVRPDFGSGMEFLHAPSDPELLERFYGQSDRKPAVARAKPEKPLELLDHFTGALWPAPLRRHYFEWEPRRGQFHLIEGVSSELAST
jgi:hypothetical protein